MQINLTLALSVLTAASLFVSSTFTLVSTSVSVSASEMSSGPTMSIPQGASTPGNPSFDPDKLTVKKGDIITITNDDSAPHTVTNGVDPQDPQSGKLFDTKIFMTGETAKIDTSSLTAGEYPFYCTVHPFMKGTLIVH